MSKKLHYKSGEIATIFVIASLIVLGVATLTSSIFLSKNKQTTSTKAVEVCNSSTFRQCFGGRRCKVKAPAGVLVYYFESDNSCLTPTPTSEPQKNPPLSGKDKGNECGSGGPNYGFGLCYKGSRCVQCQHGKKWLEYNCFETDKTCPGSDLVYCPPPWAVTACKDGGHMCCSGGNCLKNGNTGTETISISKCTDSDSFCSIDEYCSDSGGNCADGGPRSSPLKVCDASRGEYCCIKPTRMPAPTSTPIPTASAAPTTPQNTPTSTQVPTTVPLDFCMIDNYCVDWCRNNENNKNGNDNKYSYKRTEQMSKYYLNNNCSGNFFANYDENLLSKMDEYCGCVSSGNPAATETPAPTPIPVVTPKDTPTLPPTPTSAQTLPPVPIVPTGDYSAGQQICLLDTDIVKCGMNRGELTSNTACVTKNGWEGSVTESVVCKKPLDKLLPCDFFYQKNDDWIPMNKQTTINDNICDLNQDQEMTVNLFINSRIEVSTKSICLFFSDIMPTICKDVINNPLIFSLKKNGRPRLIEATVIDKNSKAFTGNIELQNWFCRNINAAFCKYTIEELKKDYNLDVTYPKQ